MTDPLAAGDANNAQQVVGRTKTNLARLLARRVDGIFITDFEQGEIGPDLFRHVCLLGLEGLVSKLKDRPYCPGRSPHWVKNKNRKHPAFSRVLDQFG